LKGSDKKQAGDTDNALDVVIVSGMSGGGKSTALNALEDLGYYCIDNLPGALLPDFGPRMLANPDLYKKVALGIDARSRDSDMQVVLDWKQWLDENGFDSKLLFITADKPVLIKRFSETRRRHPLTNKELVLSEAIENERKLLEPLRSGADQVIDTSNINIHQLRQQVWASVDSLKDGMTIVMQSFAFKYGVPQDVDFIFDARVLPNPYWQEGLKGLTGQDDAVRSWLETDQTVIDMGKDILGFLQTWLPAFIDTQRSYVNIGIGCTGGKHRSVYLAEKLADALRSEHDKVLVHHRESDSWHKTSSKQN
jgi:UPF0042 nucleotide-binding protein